MYYFIVDNGTVVGYVDTKVTYDQDHLEVVGLETSRPEVFIGLSKDFLTKETEAISIFDKALEMPILKSRLTRLYTDIQIAKDIGDPDLPMIEAEYDRLKEKYKSIQI